MNCPARPRLFARPRGFAQPLHPAVYASLCAALLCAALCAAVVPRTALALSYCASDGQAAPTVLVERFISADCAACWNAPTAQSAPANSLAIDWVLPGSQGDDAPLSAIATRDAQERFVALGLGSADLQQGQLSRSSAVPTPARFSLRVAHGLPVNDYIGTSIEAKPASAEGTADEPTLWLLLVEHIPAGFEGSPIARNIVRNALQGSWNMREQLLKNEQLKFYEARPMQVASGAQAARLRVAGWLQSGSGAVLAAAASLCQDAAP